ncbi:hypothetical protein FHS43_006185 [Streptosporangium becharense]|uniref:Uncharacterized protein n=1 Tax=Streptosporangium becharense TaxID=1816182 RepID=A0A7W9MH89_9ACTN|nr:hypothetical protein [Streptosporangium becharense]MBB2914873.1 hypothetical protein [Streptosporangium becharense]MBB5820316.1 hypothetical protein [Streptosporangium becharense]
MTTTRHLVITIALDGRRLALGHATGGRLGADLIAAVDPALDPRAEACGCDTPPNLSDACRAGGCGMCIGYLDNQPVPCDHDCHPVEEIARLKPGQEPPDPSYLETWMRHWRERALKAEARVAGAHAQTADARRRELDAATRWRDCHTHAGTILELRTHVDRLNDVMEPYEQLRLGLVTLHYQLGEATGRGRVIDLAAVGKRIGKLIDACNRGLAKATEVSRAREEGER